MDVVISIAAKIAEYTVEPVGRWLCYSFQYGSNIENLKNRVKELEGPRDRVKHDIEAARRNAEEIETDVNAWLEKVGEIIQKAKEVLESEDKGSLRFANEECLNLKQRHQLSRKARKIVQGVDDDKILEKGNFKRVSYRPAPERMVTSTYRNYLSFESRKSTMIELLAALKDTNINLIGVWGMGGVGKSMLVNEVARQAKEEKLFDEVAVADVTQHSDIRRIQGEIADTLDVKFDVETERGRARHLMERLTRDKKILVVLDDIWKRLDLEEIGIPCKGCKVVLISRNRDILRQLDTHRDFGLETLPQDEAWNLFEMMVGTSLQGPRFLDIATELAKKCAGLPIALTTVSNALKAKRLEIWKDALRQLERPTSEHLTEMQSTIYKSVRVSYDHLQSHEMKYFFFYCAMMPGYHIWHSDLLQYCHGLGLFSRINTLEEARNNIHRLVWSLKDFGLLQDCQSLGCSQKNEHCHMHDVVRDVARSIALEDHNMIFVGVEDKLKGNNEDVLQRCKELYIDGGIHELPNDMKLLELRLLFINAKGGLLQISDAFFQEVKKLRVLDFTNVKLSSLPPSFLFLTSLRTLCFYNCVLEDITIIGKLENLEILSLCGSNISELPKDIGLLTHLRQLDLSLCSKLEVIPPNVLSSLVELEELYMGGTSIHWEAKDVDNERDNASLIELKHLSRLVTLELQIRDAHILPEDLLFEKLERYKILIGDVWKWSNVQGNPRTLKVKSNMSNKLEVGIRNLLKKVEYLCLDELKGINSILLELDKEGFQHLKHLQIQNNEIKFIIDSRISVIAFSSLETLLLQDMINLEVIYHGQLSSKTFDKLRVVKMTGCRRLKYFISLTIACGLSQLEELQITDCINMVAIVVEEKGQKEEKHMVLFPKLRGLVLLNLPKLECFLSLQNSCTTNAGEIISKDKLDCYMQILHGKLVFSKLEKLELSSIHWGDVRQEKQEASSSCRFTSMPTISWFQSLVSLIVHGSGNIERLLSLSTAKSMVQLKSLEIRECNIMEEVLLTGDFGGVEEIIPNALFPQLETLSLIELPFLKWFCKGSKIEFPSLKELKIEGCPKFMTFICKLDRSGMTANKELIDTSANESSYSVIEPLFNEMVVFPKLEELRISHIVDLKSIWHDQFIENSFCKLQTLIIESCENLTNVFQAHVLARFQRLSRLKISDCESIQEVFELQGFNDEGTHAVTAIPLKWLILLELPKLQYVWSKDPHQIFTFQDLQEVYHRGCESLKSLFMASVARSLPQLEILSIHDCGVEEIVAREDEALAVDRPAFPRVTHLALRGLPRMEQFYPGLYTAEWPKLKKIWVQGCPFDPTLSSLEEEPEESHQETSNKKLYFIVDKAQAKCVDSLREFVEDINYSDFVQKGISYFHP